MGPYRSKSIRGTDFRPFCTVSCTCISGYFIIIFSDNFKTYSGREFSQRNEDTVGGTYTGASWLFSSYSRMLIVTSQPSTYWIPPGSTIPAGTMFVEVVTKLFPGEFLNSGHCALCFQHRKGSNKGSDRQKLLRKQ